MLSKLTSFQDTDVHARFLSVDQLKYFLSYFFKKYIQYPQTFSV